MTSLILVRHGETVWHAENRYAGVSDIELTERGQQQAARLAAWSTTAGLDAVWSSPLRRAKTTAIACTTRTGLPLAVDDRLRELDFGAGEGLTSAEMEQRFPHARKAFGINPVTDHLPDGENPRYAADRFTACLHDIAEQYPDGRVLVVAHTTAIRLALCRLIGVELSEYRRLFPFVRNCGLTELCVTDGRTALLEFNTPISSSSGNLADPITEPSSTTTSSNTPFKE